MSRFQPSRSFRAANRMVVPLLRLGIPMGLRRAPMANLTVRGRKSQVERTTPVSVLPRDDGWLLVAVYGRSDWSINLEAAGEARLTLKGEQIEVSARRLQPGEGGPVLREAMLGAPSMIQRMTAPYFTAGAGSPDADWEREAIAHPVFVLPRKSPIESRR